jgi:hypothetical protein
MIGNTALVLEAEMFGQPSLRAKWKKKYGARPEDISGLAVEEHVARLRDNCSFRLGLCVRETTRRAPIVSAAS